MLRPRLRRVRRASPDDVLLAPDLTLAPLARKAHPRRLTDHRLLRPRGRPGKVGDAVLPPEVSPHPVLERRVPIGLDAALTRLRDPVVDELIGERLSLPVETRPADKTAALIDELRGAPDGALVVVEGSCAA